MNKFSKVFAATAAALTIGAIAAPAQSAIYVAYDIGGGIVGESIFADGPFAYLLGPTGGWDSVSIEGQAPPVPGLLHSEVVNLNSSGAASIDLYITRTGLNADDLKDYLAGNRFLTGFGYAALGGGFTSTGYTYVDDADGTYGGVLLASDTFTGTLSQATNFVTNIAGLSGTYSVTHKYTVTAKGDGSVSPDIVLDTAVPEPGTWALMIMGFGGAGAMLRSRRKALVAA